MKRLLALLLASVCLVGGSGGLRAQEAPLEVLHWLTAESEVAALKSISTQFEKEGGKWVDSAVSPPTKARALTVTRIVGGNPPGAAMTQGQRVFAQLLDEELLRGFKTTADEGKWKDVLPSAIFQDMSFNDDVVAVPVELDTMNWVYYDNEVMAKSGATPAKTWPELVTVLDKIKAAGFIPLAVSSRPTQIRRTFLSVAAGMLGPDAYNEVFTRHNLDVVNGPDFKAAVDVFAALRGYGDPGQSGREWQQATDMLITHRAGVQIQGDWVQGAFAAAGKEPGKDYTCEILGGNAVVLSNMMIFPKTSDAGVAAAQEKLAKVMMEPDVQLGYAKQKGTIPIRTDVDASSLGACAQTSARYVKEGHYVLDDTYGLDPGNLGKFQDLTVLFWSKPEMTSDEFIQEFARTISVKM